MAKGRALKEEMMMSKKEPMMKAKDGFPAMPMKNKFADDLGYFTKAKKPGTGRKGK